jgi:hypothetical protein
VLTRKDENGVIILCIYVNDALMVGDHAAIEKTVAQLKTEVYLKDVGPLSEHVGCTMVKKKKKKVVNVATGFDCKNGKGFQATH